MNVTITDGGRKEAGFKGECRDCVVRAIAVAMSHVDPLFRGARLSEAYTRVYRDIKTLAAAAGKASPRGGVDVRSPWFKAYMAKLGWIWQPTAEFGSKERLHLGADFPQKGTYIVRLSKHVVAVIDGVIYDNHDPQRGGRRMVYGFWRRKTYLEHEAEFYGWDKE